MKKCVSVLMVLIVFLNCQGQDKNDNGKKYPVAKVKDWSSRAFLFRRDFWDIFRDTAVMQIGAREFEKVIRFSAVERMPFEMTLFKGFQRIDKDKLAALDIKLDKLITYKIATLMYRGKEVGFRSRVILRVPYKENANWDPVAKWDTVYFVLPVGDVE